MSEELDPILKEKFNKYKRCILIEYLASRLQDEQILVKYFNSQVTIKYRNLRRKEKCEELKQSLLDLFNSAKTCIYYKNLLINLYEIRLNDYDKLDKHIADNFIIVRDELILNFKQTITNLKENYLNEISLIKSHFNNEKEKLGKLNNESLRDLDYQILCFEANAQEINALEINAKKLEYDELKTRYQDEKIVFKIESEKRIKQLENEFLNEKKTYENNLLCWRRPDSLNVKEEKLNKIILKDKYRIEILISKLKETNKEFNHYDFRLLEDKKKFLNTKLKEYNKHIKQMNNESQIRKIKLVKLVTESSRALTSLNLKHAKLSKIIRLLKLCQKKETNQCIDQDETQIENDLDLESFLSNTTHELNQLLASDQETSNKLNSRNAQLLVEIKSLQLEQSNLKQENNQLRQLLSEYMRSIKS